MAASVESVRGLDPENLDRTVSPAENFYRFANGKWLDSNPIPDEYSRWGSFEQLHELSQEQLHVILEQCKAIVSESQGNENIDMHTKLVGILYATGIDEEACDMNGFKPMEDVYDMIDGAETVSDLFALVASLSVDHGVSAGFCSMGDRPDAKNSNWSIAYLSQSGNLGIGDRDFYLEDDKKDIREKYEEHVERMLKLSGIHDDVANKAKAMMNLETRIAESCMTMTERRDPHKTYNKFSSPEDLAKRTNTDGKIPWQKYFALMGLEGDFGGIVLENPAFVERMGELFESEDLSTWKTYARYHATNSMAPYLGNDAVKENFAFHTKVMSGQPEMKPRWKRICAHVGSLMEESLGIKYVERHFSPHAKKVCKEMVDILTDVLRSRFDEIEWMGPETKKRAHTKLDRFRAKIGYPDRWDIEHCRDLVESLKLDAPYAFNVRSAMAIETKRSVKRVNKPVDPEKWYFAPYIVNACFVPTRVEILFPSAILQPPFFIPPTKDSPHGDPPVNFAAIGAVICHEISHGYDDQGRKYDENGELNDWWTQEDSDEYNRRAEKMVEQFNEFKVHGVPVNGKLCLGENVADLGGVKLAYIGLKRFMKEHGRPADIDGFTPEQRFFLSWYALFNVTFHIGFCDSEENLRSQRCTYFLFVTFLSYFSVVRATIWRNNIRKEMALKRIVMDRKSQLEISFQRASLERL